MATADAVSLIATKNAVRNEGSSEAITAATIGMIMILPFLKLLLHGGGLVLG